MDLGSTGTHRGGPQHLEPNSCMGPRWWSGRRGTQQAGAHRSADPVSCSMAHTRRRCFFSGGHRSRLSRIHQRPPASAESCYQSLLCIGSHLPGNDHAQLAWARIRRRVVHIFWTFLSIRQLLAPSALQAHEKVRRQATAKSSPHIVLSPF